ncbi:MAG: NADH-quinone oxidoreductase subunit D [Oligoflexia bacterium]|nr:NADH-quinone oxidoreductase subunit D [Oligoflexia bacterium]
MLETLRTDLTSWEIGPYHGALPGPMRMKLRIDGEIIISTDLETGFLHRGLEKAFELHPWPATVAYADHLDPEAAFFGELALCLAVEEISGLDCPPRAQAIRVLLSELSRISAHLGYIVKVGRAVGAETLIHYVLRDREKILDLFELLSGARYSLNFLRFGGVAADVTEGFIERVLEVAELLRARLKEYNDLFTFNHSFLLRTAGVGVITRELALQSGLTGPNARAAGLAFDARKAHPYIGFDKLDFEVPVGRGEAGRLGDAHDRFLVRLRELSQSLEILKDVAETVPEGEFSRMRIDRDFEVPNGESYARVESSRGLLGCHVVSDGGRFPARVQFRVPTSANLTLLPEIVRGLAIEDLPVVIASLDLCLAEADR